jgi:hypothetical protein
MVSLRKLLCLNITTAGPSTGTQAVSKEMATGTPAEKAMLRDVPDDKGANSDAGSSHGEPAAELSGRESRDEMESKEALTWSNLENENATLEYKGKNTQELRQWIRSLEDNHKTFSDVFDLDQKCVYYASRALKPDTQSYKHWMSKCDAKELENITWKIFVNTIYGALGSKEVYVAQAYYSHQEAKENPKR